jgi:hypothetical protein
VRRRKTFVFKPAPFDSLLPKQAYATGAAEKAAGIKKIK